MDFWPVCIALSTLSNSLISCYTGITGPYVGWVGIFNHYTRVIWGPWREYMCCYAQGWIAAHGQISPIYLRYTRHGFKTDARGFGWWLWWYEQPFEAIRGDASGRTFMDGKAATTRSIDLRKDLRKLILQIWRWILLVGANLSERIRCHIQTSS